MSDDVVSQVINHRKLYLTDPDAAHDWNSYGQPKKALLLLTKGRRTGKACYNPLVYKPVGDAYVIVASKGGSDAHPAWYLNLVAEPDVEIRLGSRVLQTHARTAEGAERAALWADIAAEMPQYAEYQSRTARELPVIVLEPRS